MAFWLWLYSYLSPATLGLRLSMAIRNKDDSKTILKCLCSEAAPIYGFVHCVMLHWDVIRYAVMCLSEKLSDDASHCLWAWIRVFKNSWQKIKTAYFIKNQGQPNYINIQIRWLALFSHWAPLWGELMKLLEKEIYEND